MTDFEGYYEFYETSRQNIIIILIFWGSYIVAYLIFTQLISLSLESTPRSNGTQHVAFSVRRKRSNLSRLMLLDHPHERRRIQARSQPPASLRAMSEERGANPFAASDSIEDISRSVSISRDEAVPDDQRSTRGLAETFSFSVEFTAACLGLCLFLQGMILLPVVAYLDAILYRIAQTVALEDDATKWYYWQWLGEKLLRRWWKWHWRFSLFFLYVGLPLALLLWEWRQHRSASLLRRIAILRGRVGSILTGWHLWKPLAALFILLTAYFILVAAGRLNSRIWLDYLIGVTVFGTAVLSWVATPLGIIALFRMMATLSIKPSLRPLLESELSFIEGEIAHLDAKGSCHSPLRAISMDSTNLVSESTPVSSRSNRLHLADLYLRSAMLKKQLRRTRKPFWYNVMIFSAIGILLVGYLLFSILLFWRTVGFLFSRIIWQVSGIQLADRLLHRIALALGLYHSRSGHHVSEGCWSLVDSLAFHYFVVHFFAGLYVLVGRQIRSFVECGLSNRRMTLDRVLMLLWLGLLCVSPGSIVILASSIFESSEESPLILALGLWRFAPKAIVRILRIFETHHVLRFPMLSWMILLHRIVLLVLIVLVARRIKSVLQGNSADTTRRPT